MCGITGWIDWTRDLTKETHVLQAMNARLAERGPDAEGYYLSEHAALGHRRLVVVDPVGGGQPMVKKRGQELYVLTYNGELYNTQEIRDELMAKGYTLTSYSDTEVLLTAYIQWGPACLDRLNGIFAFAVWDESRQALFMARDRMGVKPLFYIQVGASFLFGSQIKALLANPLVPHEIDMEGLAEVFCIGPARTPGLGVFRNVKELRAGHCLEHTRSGTTVRQYWKLENRPHVDDLTTTAQTVGCLLQDTVQRQLVSDVPVCTLLSGGLDSSAITAIASDHYRQRGEQLHTWSIDYEGNDRFFRVNEYQPNSDAPWVERVSKYLGTVHHRVVVETKHVADALVDAVRASDLPGMADIDSSLNLFCREVKKSATVALSGESADEVFGGYPWFRNPEATSSGTFPWARKIPERSQLLAKDIRNEMEPAKYVERRYREALDEVPRLRGETSEQEKRRELFHLNFTRFMPTLLDRKDRMSMASGLEVRVPFCDHRLVEYVWNIPWEMKFCDQIEKGILRRAVASLLPQDVLARKKSPYPKTHNPAYMDAVKKRFREIYYDRSSPLPRLLDSSRVTEVLESDAAVFGPSWFGQLMGNAQLFAYLIQVDTWMRENRVLVA